MSTEVNVEEVFAQQLANLRAGVVNSGTALSKQECRRYINSLRGKHIIITGGASGIGRDLALIAGRNGAHVSIGDLNLEGAKEVAAQLTAEGKKAIARKCSVTDWNSQRDFFKAAEAELGPIDIVFPGAGVTEKLHPGFEDDEFEKNGDLAKPLTLTLDINLIGVIYTTKLAYYYLRKDPTRKGKALIFIGSMASWHSIPRGPMYSAAKAGVLGLMRSSFYELGTHGIRTAVICPWFVETGIIEPLTRLALIGLPFAQIDDVTSAIIAAVSHPDQYGTALIVDPSGVYSVPIHAPQLGEGSVYDEFGRRALGTLTLKAITQDTYKTVRAFSARFYTKRPKLTWTLLLASLAIFYRRRKAAKATS